MNQPAAQNLPLPAGSKPEDKPAKKSAGAGSKRASAPLAVELRVAIMRASRRLRTEAASKELSPAHYSVLGGIRTEPLTVGQLAEREQVQAPSMTRIVNNLEASGLVERRVNELDKRQVIIAITDLGVEQFRKARSKRTQWLSKRLAALTAEERATLHEAAAIMNKMSAS